MISLREVFFSIPCELLPAFAYNARSELMRARLWRRSK